MSARKQLAITAAIALALSLGVLSNCSGTGASTPQHKTTFAQVSSAEAAQMMKDETGYAIVDVRTPSEFADGHIPGAINIPVETIGSSEPAELVDKDQLILVYCRSGNRSVTASIALAEMGYTNVVEFGGIIDWTGDVVKD